MERSLSRRTVLASLAASSAVAGCVSSGSPDAGDGSEPTDAASSTPVTSSTATETDTTDLDDWLADANGYDGDIPRTGIDGSVSVWVGERSGDGETYHAFDPPAIEVRPGTTVYWEWTGHGGAHNVVAVDGPFKSGEPVAANTGTIFGYTFDEVGTYRYVCENHRDDGMKGAVVVAPPPSTGYDELDEWLFDVGNWGGDLTDRTDASTVSVIVGAEGNGGEFGFEPPALKVSTGTTVEWEWTGIGGGHDVAFESADIERSDIYTDEGVHFEHTFEESGVYRYTCRPHRGIGMKGGIVVEE